jgi:hypothetical protein
MATDAPGKSDRKLPSITKNVLRCLGAAVLVGAALAVLSVPLEQQTRIAGETLDFANFYAAGRIVLSGQSRHLYDFQLQRRVEDSYSTGGPFMAYLHPPFEALLFAGLAWLSYPQAFLAWGAINLCAISLVFFLIRGAGYKLDGASYLIWVVTCLFFAISNLALGQDALWLAVVFLLSFLQLKRRRDFAAGAVLGLGLFRFEFLLPFVLIFALRRRWRVIAGSSVVGAVWLSISAAVVGWGGLLSYANALIQVGTAARGVYVDHSDAHMMPSLYGLLWTTLRGWVPESVSLLVVLAGTLALLAWAALHFRHIDRAEHPAFDLEFSLAVVAALLSGYHVFISELAPIMVVAYLVLAYESGPEGDVKSRGHVGGALLAMFLAVIAALIISRSERFSLEVVTMLALGGWLTREASKFKRVGLPAG